MNVAHQLHHYPLEQFTARKLVPDDGPALRILRLHALRTEGEFFGPTYEAESRLTQAEWRARCTETPRSCHFGLFDNTGEMIGVTYAGRWDEDATGATAWWGRSYIRPEYRGEHLMAELYRERLDWTRAQPEFKRAVLFIREGNTRSIDIHEKHGAHYIDTRDMQWPDRPPSKWRWYSYTLGD